MTKENQPWENFRMIYHGTGYTLGKKGQKLVNKIYQNPTFTENYIGTLKQLEWFDNTTAKSWQKHIKPSKTTKLHLRWHAWRQNGHWTVYYPNYYIGGGELDYKLIREAEKEALNADLLNQTLINKYNQQLHPLDLKHLLKHGVTPGATYKLFTLDKATKKYALGEILVGQKPWETLYLQYEDQSWDNIFYNMENGYIGFCKGYHSFGCGRRQEFCGYLAYIAQELAHKYKVNICLEHSGADHLEPTKWSYGVRIITNNITRKGNYTFKNKNNKLELILQTDNGKEYKPHKTTSSNKNHSTVTLRDMKQQIENIKTEYGTILTDPLTPITLPALLITETPTTQNFLDQLTLTNILTTKLENGQPTPGLQQTVTKLTETWHQALAYAESRGKTIFTIKQQETITKAENLIKLGQNTTNPEEVILALTKAKNLLEEIMILPDATIKALTQQKTLTT